ncbi:GTPase [uncultured Cellulomonas sp.]|uniref:GTPase n=1 Tax=uncultured Cellulomonas sp. TaxID=189682 RepID=UPI0026220C35|nr:GTPase [uncultured Cellulomonas sp.]
MTQSHDGRHVGRPAGPPGAAGAGGAPARGAHRSLSSELTGRVEALDAALAAAGDRLTPGVAQDVRRTVAAVRDRLGRGIDHTLVALVGGTGSGKSSLFNALCGLPLADVDVRRPTTSEATACVWGRSGEALLDWLGVAPGRRFQRETALDGDAEADLRGLVLLDLPDHDSVASGHREVVDRLLPMVDLLVWVVDPQKYADDALHSAYLRALVGQEAAMVVVMNQVDTVPADVRDRLLADVGRLLAEDGLVGVPVLATSVPEGTGITELRATLAGVVAGSSVAAVRAGAELAVAGRALATDVAPAVELSPDHLPTGAVVDALVDAAGLPAIADAVGATVQRGTGAVAPVGAVQAHTVGLARHRWLGEVGRGLPVGWRRSLDERLPASAELAQAVGSALPGVTPAARRSRAATAFAFASVVLGLAAVAVAGALGADALLGTDVADAVAGVPVTAGLGAGLAVLLAVLALGAWAVARSARRRAARRRSATVRREGRAAVEDVVAHRLVEPTLALLAEHRHVRDLAGTAAADDHPIAPATPGAPAATPSTG